MTEPAEDGGVPRTVGAPSDLADAALGSVGRKLWILLVFVGVVGAANYGWGAYGRYRSSLAGFQAVPAAGPAAPPQDWQVERAQGYEAACPPDWLVDADFTGPFQWKCVAQMADLGQYPPNCNIIVEPKTDDVVFSSSQEYWSAIRDDMQKSLPSFHLGREETAWFQGVEGIRAEFTHSSAGPETRAFGYYLVGVHNAAVITCSAPPDLAGPYEQTLEGLAGHIYIEAFEPEPERAIPSK